MKKFTLIALVMALLISLPMQVEAGRRKGRKQTVSITKVVNNLKEYRGKMVTLVGKIVEQDTQGYGFWFVISDGKENIKVDLIKHQINFYHNKMGKEAEIRGKLEYRFGEWWLAAKKYIRVDGKMYRPGSSIFTSSEF